MILAAANLSVGFITEAGQAVVNYVTTGASTIFPQGIYHALLVLGLCNLIVA